MEPRAAIAGVHDPWPGNQLPKALLADVVVTIERRDRTEKPIVVQGLDNGDAGIPASGITGWRNEGERIMKVSDLWMMIVDRNSDTFE